MPRQRSQSRQYVKMAYGIGMNSATLLLAAERLSIDCLTMMAPAGNTGTVPPGQYLVIRGMTNTVSEVDDNIADFPVTFGGLLWQGVPRRR